MKSVVINATLSAKRTGENVGKKAGTRTVTAIEKADELKEWATKAAEENKAKGMAFDLCEYLNYAHEAKHRLHMNKVLAEKYAVTSAAKNAAIVANAEQV